MRTVPGQPYVRVRATENGDTIFVDDTFPLAVVHMWEGRVDGKSAPLDIAEVTVRRILEDSSDPFVHSAPAPQFIVVLEGVVEVEVSDGTKRRFGPSSIILMEDTGGKGHVSRWVVEAEQAEPLVLVLRLAQKKQEK